MAENTIGHMTGTREFKSISSYSPNADDTGLSGLRADDTNVGGKREDNSLGFGTKTIFTMNANQGSEYTISVAKAFVDAYNQLPAATRPKVSILDREVITELAYSSIVVSSKIKNNVLYYIVLLEATGRKPMKVSEIIAEVLSATKINTTPNVFTPDDAIDDVLHSVIKSVLRKEYPNGGDTINNIILTAVDGVVVPTHHGDTAVMAARLASIAFNACTVDQAINSGELIDLNIKQARTKSNKLLKIESNMSSSATSFNEVGEPIRSDWTLSLSAIDLNNKFTSLNTQNQNVVLSKVTGYTEAFPVEVSIPVGYNMPPVTQLRLRPHIILTSNSVFMPSTGYALLGIISSLVMTNPNMWVASVMPNPIKKNNNGVLNILTNLENNQNRIGAVIDFNNKKSSTDEIYSVIKQMYSQTPVVSIDLPSFGPETYYESIFAKASETNNTSEKISACNIIIKSANWLTDGHFPADFPINEIFANSGIVIPNGRWSDKTGERDIRDIDLTFITEHTTDTNIINRWILSNLPQSVTGNDPFFTKLDIINKLIPDAEITGRSVRVMFTSKFISTLSNAAMQAGLDVKFEPEITFADNTSIGSIGGYLDNAGIQGAAGFARYNTVTGPNFSMGYGNMGYNRHYN